MTRRYYVSELPKQGGVVSLSADESAHAIRVMRVKVDDAIMLFDGRGGEATATVQSVGRRECVCSAETVSIVDREPAATSHFGIALPKPDRAKELIERLTELGVARVTPLVCERSQRPPAPGLLTKLQRVVIEACKQSGRNRLMEIGEPVKAVDFFAESAPIKWIAHPGGQPLGDQSGLVESVVVAIGPEGGFRADELEAALRDGYTAIDLGPRIYRIETAAACIASFLAR